MTKKKSMPTLFFYIKRFIFVRKKIVKKQEKSFKALWKITIKF
jgi:hypothetical protein